MNMHKKRIARRGAAFVCAFGVALSAMPVHAAEVKSLEDKTSNLQSQLEGINQDLVTISNKIAETEAEIEESNNEVYRLEASLQISRNNEEKQYETMKTRIKYMYENGSETMITMLFTADSMGDFLNKAEFIQNITDYDKEMLEKQEEDLKSQPQELTDLQSQLNTEQQNLQAKAAATSTDLATVNAQLQAAREAQAKQEAEAQKKAQEEAAKQASASTGNNTSGSSSSNGKYNIPSGGLTPSKGRIWFNGHTETYYSQKVLPGTGLNIPGRHIASDGTIRDKDGYIVLASDDYPKGTVVETSLGAGKVYDSGSGKGNIDLYTDW